MDKVWLSLFYELGESPELSQRKSSVKNESSLKTSYFGLKPGKWLIFNCPDLKVGAIEMLDNQGFSHINEILDLFRPSSRIINVTATAIQQIICR